MHTNSEKDVNLIVNRLKKDPAPLSRPLYRKLRYYRLLSSPQECHLELLCNAADSTRTATSYSKGVKQALMGALALDSLTKDLELVFKQGTASEPDFVLQGRRLMINDRLLDFKLSHDGKQCGLSVEASLQQKEIESYDCGHVITDLYDSLVAQLLRTQRNSRHSLSGTQKSMTRMVEQKISRIPTRVTIFRGELPGELGVRWWDFDSDRVYWTHGRLLRKGRITLHRESTCSHMRNEPLSTRKSLSSLLSSGHLRHQRCECA